MASNVTALPASGSGPPARSLSVSRARTARRILLDSWASRVVVVGGVVIIASILAILFVIAAEVYPLFKKPVAARVGSYVPSAVGGPQNPAPGRSIGMDEYREVGYEVTRSGILAFVSLTGGPSPSTVAVPWLEGAEVTAVADVGKGRYVIGSSNGRVTSLEMRFDVAFDDGKRTVAPRPVFAEPSLLDPDGKRPLLRLTAAMPESGAVTVAQVGPAELTIQSVVEKKALIGGGRKEESRQTLRVPGAVEVTALALDGRAEDLFVGTATGRVVRYDLRDRDNPKAMEATQATSRAGVPVSVLGFLLGDRTLIVGDAAGDVSTWQVVPPAGGGEARLTLTYRFEPHAAAVVSMSASPRDKGFATADAGGTVHISYGTSGQTLLSFKAEQGGLEAVAFAPKSDGVLAADGRGRLVQWRLDNPHPEVTFKTLFGKIWYEGYSRPEYVWQSTGGTDDFEAKFSLTPLIFGTLKGTFYALLFAVPLALLAALYVSEFMHPTVKGYVKPVVEIMAALPSVVLGFLAGLWLAPVVERIVPGLFLLPLILPPAILAAYSLWRLAPRPIRGRFKTGTEVFLLIPVVLGGAWMAFALGGLVEATLLGGNYRGWLLSALGLTYDQRNSLVVGVAMGFAVIPIIFTIAEDSLANVPQHLRAGSLALGATRWQTALRIVLPTASPGIFSAIMIGFGRAVGETMIVLMATGNTPVMDWSIFNGFRALSANVAVEMPEAPESGTLFRVLFLAALLLFCLTFVVNTMAELVRLKLRRKYRYL